MENPALSLGHHSHKCGKCQHVWVHSDEMRGEWRAHMCPACAEGPWFYQHEWAKSCMSALKSLAQQLRQLLEGVCV